MLTPDEFFAQCRYLAFYGCKRNNTGYGALVLAGVAGQLDQTSITLVHPLEYRRTTYRSVNSAVHCRPAPDSALIVLNPEQAADALRDAAQAGVQRAWLVLNAASADNLALARVLGVETVDGCPLLFLPGQGFPHNLHRGLAKLFGRI